MMQIPLAMAILGTVGTTAAVVLSQVPGSPAPEPAAQVDLLLHASPAPFAPVPEGKTRIIVPVDDAFYEVIIATPKAEPQLLPASR